MISITKGRIDKKIDAFKPNSKVLDFNDPTIVTIYRSAPFPAPLAGV